MFRGVAVSKKVCVNRFSLHCLPLMHSVTFSLALSLWSSTLSVFLDLLIYNLAQNQQTLFMSVKGLLQLQILKKTTT